MKNLLLLLSVLPAMALAQTAKFDATTQVLTLPVLEIGTQTLANVRVRLDAVTIVSVDAPVAPAPGIAAVCTDAFFTTATLQKLQAYEGKIVTDPQILINIVGCQPTTNAVAETDIGLKWTSSQSGKLFAAGTAGHVLSPIGRVL